MTTNYPNSFDSFPVHTDNTNETVKAAHVNNLQDAVVAIQQALGIGFNVTNWNNLFSSVQNNVSNLQYDVYNMELANYYNSIVTNKSGMYFDGFSDTTKADTTSTTTTTALTVGQSTLTGVSPIPAGFKVGQEVIVVDDTNYEFTKITAVSPNLTVSALKNSYKAGAIIARSSSAIDTVNRKLNMPNVNIAGTTTITTPNTIVSSTGINITDNTFNLSALVRLTNGWLVMAVDNSTANQIIWYVSKDNGNTWSQLCYYTTNDTTPSISICSSGTTVCTALSLIGTPYFVKFDATTVTNTDVSSTKITIESTSAVTTQSVDIGFDGTGKLWFVYTINSSTYPNSRNIKYRTSTDSGNTWAAAVYLLTTPINTSGISYWYPNLVFPNGNPVITCCYSNTTVTPATYTLYSFVWSGSSFTQKTIYTTTTYNQTWIETAHDSTGANLRAVWQAYSSSATSVYNIYTSLSTDGGNTWSAPVQLTNNTAAGQSQQHPSLAFDSNNNCQLLFDGVDTSISSTYAQIRKMTLPAGSATWSAITSLTNNTTASAQYPNALWSSYNQNCSFTDALVFYLDNQAAALKFRGTWQSTVAYPAKWSTLYSNRVSYSQTQKNTKVWNTRSVTVSLSPSAAVAAGAASVPISKPPATVTSQVFSNPLTSSAAWTTRAGSFAFGSGGASSNSNGSIITAGPGWIPLQGSGGQNLAMTTQMTYTTPATVQTGRIYLYLNATNYYVASFSSTGLYIGKLYNNVSYSLNSSSTPVAAASATYTLSLSLDSTGHLTLQVFSASGALISSLTATDTTITGTLQPGVGGDTGVIITNNQTTAPLPNLVSGDIIEIREGNNWERTTINGAISSTSNSIPVSPALVNAYSTNAVLARVDETAQCFIGAAGATENFSPMTWQGSSLNPDGTVEDTYYYSNATGGTDVVYKFLQTRDNAGTSPQATKYGAVVGF